MNADRLAFLRQRCREMRARGYFRVDDLPLMLAWLEEALREVPRQATLLDDAA